MMPIPGGEGTQRCTVASGGGIISLWLLYDMELSYRVSEAFLRIAFCILYYTWAIRPETCCHRNYRIDIDGRSGLDRPSRTLSRTTISDGIGNANIVGGIRGRLSS